MGLLDDKYVKEYLLKYPYRYSMFNDCVPTKHKTKSHPNGVKMYVVRMRCEDPNCASPNIEYDVELRNLSKDKIGDGLYRCRRCAQAYVKSHTPRDVLKFRARKAINTQISKNPNAMSNRVLKGYNNMGEEKIKEKMKRLAPKMAKTRNERGTWFRSNLEPIIDSEFGSIHGGHGHTINGLYMEYEIDCYWPDLKMGIEIDDYGTHKDKEYWYHHLKRQWAHENGIKLLNITINSPREVRRPGYKDWRDLVVSFLDGTLSEEYEIMWEDAVYDRG